MSCQNKECLEQYIQLLEAMNNAEDRFLEKIDILNNTIDLLMLTSEILRETIEKVADETLSIEDVKKFVALAKTLELPQSSIEILNKLDPSSPKGQN